jgi:hypothetical protein
VSHLRHELVIYIPEDILHSHLRGNLKSYIALLQSIQTNLTSPLSMNRIVVLSFLNIGYTVIFCYFVP